MSEKKPLKISAMQNSRFLVFFLINEVAKLEIGWKEFRHYIGSAILRFERLLCYFYLIFWSVILIPLATILLSLSFTYYFFYLWFLHIISIYYQYNLYCYLSPLFCYLIRILFFLLSGIWWCHWTQFKD